MKIQSSVLVHLGFGKYVRSDRVTAVIPIEEERGPGRRTFVHVDGEIIGMTPVSIECVPGGLTIFVPRVEEDPVVEKLTGLADIEITLKPVT